MRYMSYIITYRKKTQQYITYVVFVKNKRAEIAKSEHIINQVINV